MRRFRRETAGGGEIAMMAVITKAMGAFLVLMIILLPYYTSDPVAQRTAEETTEQVEKAKEQLQQAQAALKKGRLTDEEIDELLALLVKAIQNLEEALLNIHQLKLQVDHLTAQVNRLEAEVAAQQQEIAALKEEIERLKRLQNPEARYWSMVRMEWSRCVGANLNVYVASSLPDKKGTLNPPPDRTAQDPPFPTDKAYSEVTQNRVEAGRQRPGAGFITWVMDDMRLDEVLTVYVKYLNALPGGPNECDLTANWTGRPDSNGKLETSIKGKVSDKEPYALLVRLKGGQRGSLAPVAVTDQERQAFQTQIVASRCDGVSCGLDDPQARPALVQAIVDRFIGPLVPDFLADKRLSGNAADPTELQRGEALLGVLGERYASKQMTYADVAKWVGILGASLSPGGSAGSKRLRDVYVARLREAGAPDVVLDMFRYRSNSSSFSMRAAADAIMRAGIKGPDLDANRVEDERAAARLTEQALLNSDPAMVLMVTRMVAEGRLTVEPATALIKLLNDHQGGTPRDFTGTPEAAQVQALLPQLTPPAGPLFSLLNPRSTSVPPELSLPLLKQIEPF